MEVILQFLLTKQLAQFNFIMLYFWWPCHNMVAVKKLNTFWTVCFVASIGAISDIVALNCKQALLRDIAKEPFAA